MNRIIKCSIIILTIDMVAVVSPLPDWVLAAPLDLPAMPELSAEEMARSCKDNSHKAAAVQFVRQVRYLPVLKQHLKALKDDLASRGSYIDGLKKNKAYLQTLRAQEQKLIDELNKQLGEFQKYIQQQQQQLNSPTSLQAVLKSAASKLQDDQEKLSKMKDEQKQVRAKLQNSAEYVKWAKYVTMFKKEYWQHHAGDAKDKKQKQIIAQMYDLAVQLKKAAHGTEFDKKLMRSEASHLFTTVTLSITQQLMQALIEDFTILQKINRSLQDIKTELPKELQVITQDLPAGFEQEQYLLNVQLSELHATIAERDSRTSAIAAMKQDIDALNQQIQSIVNIMQKDFKAAVQKVVDTIQQVSQALDNPPADMFDGCPYFLRDLLQGA